MKCREFGVDVQYKCGGKLVGERTWRQLRGRVTELLLAEDAVATGTDRDGMERAATELERLLKCWGLALSLAKTKLVVVRATSSEEELRPLIIAMIAIIKATSTTNFIMNNQKACEVFLRFV